MKKVLLIATIALLSACGTTTSNSEKDSILTKVDTLAVDSTKVDTLKK
jgi:outer membrane lipopolysaccharide assembly protein LptE/RlpB